MKRTTEPANDLAIPPLSKRAARRLIQRAFVLVGRDRNIRLHLHDARLTTLWTIDDWGFEWTLIVDRGKLEFHRGQAGKPALTFLWRTAEAFFDQVENGCKNGFECAGSTEAQKILKPVCDALTRTVRSVMRDPVDDEGKRIW